METEASQGFYRERSYRVAFDTNFTVPYLEGWEGVFSAMTSAEVNIGRDNNQDFRAIEQGLSCDTLGPIDECFNPWAVNPDVFDLTRTLKQWLMQYSQPSY